MVRRFSLEFEKEMLLVMVGAVQNFREYQKEFWVDVKYQMEGRRQFGVNNIDPKILENYFLTVLIFDLNDSKYNLNDSDIETLEKIFQRRNVTLRKKNKVHSCSEPNIQNDTNKTISHNIMSSENSEKFANQNILKGVSKNPENRQVIADISDYSSEIEPCAFQRSINNFNRIVQDQNIIGIASEDLTNNDCVDLEHYHLEKSQFLIEESIDHNRIEIESQNSKNLTNEIEYHVTYEEIHSDNNIQLDSNPMNLNGSCFSEKSQKGQLFDEASDCMDRNVEDQNVRETSSENSQPEQVIIKIADYSAEKTKIQNVTEINSEKPKKRDSAGFDQQEQAITGEAGWSNLNTQSDLNDTISDVLSSAENSENQQFLIEELIDQCALNKDYQNRIEIDSDNPETLTDETEHYVTIEENTYSDQSVKMDSNATNSNIIMDQIEVKNTIEISVENPNIGKVTIHETENAEKQQLYNDDDDNINLENDCVASYRGQAIIEEADYSGQNIQIDTNEIFSNSLSSTQSSKKRKFDQTIQNIEDNRIQIASENSERSTYEMEHLVTIKKNIYSNPNLQNNLSATNPDRIIFTENAEKQRFSCKASENCTNQMENQSLDISADNPIDVKEQLIIEETNDSTENTEGQHLSNKGLADCVDKNYSKICSRNLGITDSIDNIEQDLNQMFSYSGRNTQNAMHQTNIDNTNDQQICNRTSVDNSVAFHQQKQSITEEAGSSGILSSFESSEQQPLLSKESVDYVGQNKEYQNRIEIDSENSKNQTHEIEHHVTNEKSPNSEIFQPSTSNSLKMKVASSFGEGLKKMPLFFRICNSTKSDDTRNYTNMILKYRDELMKMDEGKLICDSMNMNGNTSNKQPHDKEKDNGEDNEDPQNTRLKKRKPNIPQRKLTLHGGTFINKQTQKSNIEIVVPELIMTKQKQHCDKELIDAAKHQHCIEITSETSKENNSAGIIQGYKSFKQNIRKDTNSTIFDSCTANVDKVQLSNKKSVQTIVETNTEKTKLFSNNSEKTFERPTLKKSCKTSSCTMGVRQKTQENKSPEVRPQKTLPEKPSKVSNYVHTRQRAKELRKENENVKNLNQNAFSDNESPRQTSSITKKTSHISNYKTDERQRIQGPLNKKITTEQEYFSDHENSYSSQTTLIFQPSTSNSLKMKVASSFGEGLKKMPLFFTICNSTKSDDTRNYANMILKYRDELMKMDEGKLICDSMNMNGNTSNKQPHDKEKDNGEDNEDPQNTRLKKRKPNIPQRKLTLHGGTFINKQTQKSNIEMVVPELLLAKQKQHCDEELIDAAEHQHCIEITSETSKENNSASIIQGYKSFKQNIRKDTNSTIFDISCTANVDKVQLSNKKSVQTIVETNTEKTKLFSNNSEKTFERPTLKKSCKTSSCTMGVRQKTQENKSPEVRPQKTLPEKPSKVSNYVHTRQRAKELRKGNENVKNLNQNAFSDNESPRQTSSITKKTSHISNYKTDERQRIQGPLNKKITTEQEYFSDHENSYSSQTTLIFQPSTSNSLKMKVASSFGEGLKKMPLFFRICNSTKSDDTRNYANMILKYRDELMKMDEGKLICDSMNMNGNTSNKQPHDKEKDNGEYNEDPQNTRLKKRKPNIPQRKLTLHGGTFINKQTQKSNIEMVVPELLLAKQKQHCDEELIDAAEHQYCIEITSETFKERQRAKELRKGNENVKNLNQNAFSDNESPRQTSSITKKTSHISNYKTDERQLIQEPLDKRIKTEQEYFSDHENSHSSQTTLIFQPSTSYSLKMKVASSFGEGLKKMPLFFTICNSTKSDDTRNYANMILKYRDELMKMDEGKLIFDSMNMNGNTSNKRRHDKERDNGEDNEDPQNTCLKKRKPNIPQCKLMLNGGTFGNKQTQDSPMKRTAIPISDNRLLNKLPKNRKNKHFLLTGKQKARLVYENEDDSNE